MATAKKSTKGAPQNESFEISGSEIMNKIKEIIKEGNARRVIIKNEKGDTIVELPLTVGAVGTLLAPTLAAVGAVTALLTKCTIEVVKK
jgi:hypothetical protein